MEQFMFATHVFSLSLTLGSNWLTLFLDIIVLFFGMYYVWLEFIKYVKYWGERWSPTERVA